MSDGRVSAAERSAAWSPHEGRALRVRADSRFGADGLPEGWWFGRVSAVVADERGEVYVAHRGPAGDPIVVLDGEGRYLRSWGRGHIKLAHGLRWDREGMLWLTDCEAQQVYRFDREGRLLLTLGTRDTAGCDERTFDSPTDIGFGHDGSVYVSDGYGNCRVVRFDAGGRYVQDWGSRGTEPGRFDTPHSVAVGPDGLVYVSDRHNHRICVFTPDGELRRTITGLGATQCIAFGPDGRPWVTTYRDVGELIGWDSLGGRLFELEPETFRVVSSFEVNAHWVHPTADGHLWLAGLAGTVNHLWPGWVDVTDVEQEHLGR